MGWQLVSDEPKRVESPGRHSGQCDHDHRCEWRPRGYYCGRAVAAGLVRRRRDLELKQPSSWMADHDDAQSLEEEKTW
jgi:hypothetical protein